MSIILLIICSIIGYVVIMFITVRYMIQPEEPPKPVRIAGMLEAAFGTLVWASLWFIHDNNLLLILFMLLGLFWIGVAISLYKASRLGRTICLVLSILRIPTVIGILFSILSIKMLYFHPKSKDFFKTIRKNSSKNV
jgi:hypothetical protein